MGAHGGPNMTEDGVVFYYDTGNSKSYAGEPTTNLMQLFPEGTTVPPGASWGSWEYSASVVDSPISNHPLSNQKWVKFVKTSNTNGRAGFLSQSYIANTINTFSCYVYAETGNSRIIVNSDNGGLSIISSKVDYDVANSNTVQRIHGTWTQQVNGGSLIGIRGGSGDAIGTTFYITGFQVEEKPHPTQVVDGTRSVTEGLKDFTDNSTIDLTNVSFDSNAQMNFDGTDDNLDADLQFNYSNFSVEMVASWDSLSDLFCAGTGAAGAGLTGGTNFNAHMTTSGFYVRAYSPPGGPGGWNTSGTVSSPNSTNTTYHIIVVNIGTVWYFYKNGTLAGSVDALYTPNSASTRVGIFRNHVQNVGNAGDVYMFKAYNRALTAEEVAENFNGIRSRFGI